MDLPDFSLPLIQGFLICLARVGAMVGVIPVFSGAQVPPQMRIGIVFLLSLRQRERERETLGRIGGSPEVIRFLMGSEIAFVLVVAIGLAALLTGLASRYGSEAARAIVGM